MTLVIIAALCLAIITASAQSTQATYTIGGANVVFGFARVDNVTTMFWPRFSATASATSGIGGRLNSGSTAQLPSGYTLAASFTYGTESVVRCLNLASGLAYVHLSGSPPTIIVSPLNGNDTDWNSGATVVIESGSLTYLN